VNEHIYNVCLLVYHISNNCGLLQDRLLLINKYSKQIYWIFIKGLSCTEVCLLGAASIHDLIAPATGLTAVVWSDRLQVSECCSVRKSCVFSSVRAGFG
jgi:hypothetical protein